LSREKEGKVMYVAICEVPGISNSVEVVAIAMIEETLRGVPSDGVLEVYFCRNTFAPAPGDVLDTWIDGSKRYAMAPGRMLQSA
jgi:hypothetical protein